MTTSSINGKKSPWKRRIGWSALALTGFAACMQWRNSSRRARAGNRVLCSELLPIRWQDGTDSFEAIANLEEIWASGATLSLEEDIAAGEIILVTPGKEFKGRVVGTWRDETGCYIQLRFRPADTWSMEIFEPEHALDLSTMAARMQRSDLPLPTSVRLVEVNR